MVSVEFTFSEMSISVMLIAVALEMIIKYCRKCKNIYQTCQLYLNREITLMFFCFFSVLDLGFIIRVVGSLWGKMDPYVPLNGK